MHLELNPGTLPSAASTDKATTITLSCIHAEAQLGSAMPQIMMRNSNGTCINDKFANF